MKLSGVFCCRLIILSLFGLACAAPGVAQSHADAPVSTVQDYRIGPGDQFRVYQPHVEDLDGHETRVDNSGFGILPVVGRIHFGGMTVEEAQAAIADQLKSLLLAPNPVIVVTEYRSHPVSVLGSVTNPGIYQLQGRKTLMDLISQAGGLRADAGAMVQISRKTSYGRVPDPNAKLDESGQLSVASFDLPGLMSGKNNAKDIVIAPEDVIFVQKADLIYVAGNVHKPGGFPLNSNSSSILTLQALALAEGLLPDAAAQRARIIRPSVDRQTPAKEIQLNLAQILKGKSPDVALQPNDILFVPSSAGKKAVTRTTEALIQAATGVAIFGRY